MSDDNNWLHQLLAESAEDDKAWPGPPWEPEIGVGERSTGRWRYGPSDRGAGGTVSLLHAGHSAELARYVARLREREAAFAAALRSAVELVAEEPVAIRDLVAEVAHLRDQLARAKRTVEFFTTATEPAFDVEAWLEGRAPGPQEVQEQRETAGGAGLPASATRIAELESALRGLIARVERTGGYADPVDQVALRAAQQALAGGAGNRSRTGQNCTQSLPGAETADLGAGSADAKPDRVCPDTAPALPAETPEGASR